MTVNARRGTIRAVGDDRTEAPIARSGEATVPIFTPFGGRAADPDVRLSGGEIPAAAGGVRASFGRYEIHGELGHGGMGRVYAAFDRELKRAVALKVCPAREAPAELVERFLVEAQATSQLGHPNIVPVYDSGVTPEGDLFYAMKLVRGRSLSRLLREDRPPLARLLGIFADVANGVAFAHSRGVVHRDLKPDNVMVGEFGEVLVMDWGLARVLGRTDAPAATGATKPDSRLTQVGDILGTPAYMAPEQAAGHVDRIDARTDVYALGAILYEFLAGRPPVVAPTSIEAVRMVVAGEIEPLRGDWIPAELAAVVAKAMALEPADRYETAEALARDVAAFLEGRPLAAVQYVWWQRAAKWVRRNRLLAGGIAAAWLALVLGVGATVGVVRVRQERSRQAAFDGAVARAREALAGAPKVEDVLADREPERAESPEQRAARERALGAYLKAVADLSRALAIRDDAVVRDERLRAGRELFDIALVGRDYTLARQVAADLGIYGLAPAEVEDLLDRMANEEGAVLARRRERLLAAIGDLRQGLSREGRARGADTLEDYVFEVSGYRDEQTVEVLAEALAPLVEKARRVGREALWTQPERDLATFACRVLGRLDLDSAVPVLALWMEVVWDDVLAVDCGVALCDTRRPEAEAPLLAARDRLGINGPTWGRIRRRLARVPDRRSGAEPAAADDFHRRAILRKEKGDLEGALEDLNRVLDLEPGNSGACNHRGSVRYDLGDLPGAIEDYSRAIERDPGNAEAYANRGNAFLDGDELDRARADYERALELNPAGVSARVGRGVVRQRIGDLEGAIADLAHVLERDPRNVLALVNRGFARFENGDAAGALADLDLAVGLDPQHVQARINRGAVRRARGDLEGAIADFDRAIELNPRHVDALVCRGNARCDKGDLEGGILDYDAAIQFAPNDPLAYLNRAIAWELRGDLDGALADYDDAIELDPANGTALNNRGLLRSKRGDFEGAIRDFDHALRLDPNARAPYHNRANARRRLGDLSGAISDYTRAIELNAADVVSFINRGNVRTETGDLAGAVADYDRAEQLAPNNPLIYLNRGVAWRRLGDLRRSIADSERFLDLAPDHSAASGVRQDLETMRRRLEEQDRDY